MRLVFYLSHWLTFTLAIACLAAVDSAAPAWLYPLMVVGLTVLMALPQKWNVSVAFANVLGLVLIFCWLAWIAAEFYHQQFEGVVLGDDFLRVGFLRGGSLLGLLLLAKWLRPRSTGDYWMMHAAALVQVVLACATLLHRPEDFGYRIFSLLLLGYLASGVWALVVLHLCSESIGGAPDSAPKEAPPGGLVLASESLARSRKYFPTPLGLTTALWWGGLGLVLAVVLFLIVPRVGRGDPRISLGMTNPTRPVTGVSPGIDLSSSQSLSLSDELVLHLEAFDSSGNKICLDDRLRLRVLTCSVYEKGKWLPTLQPDWTFVSYRNPIQPSSGQYRLQLQVDLTKLPLTIGMEGGGHFGELKAGAQFPLPVLEPHPALARPNRVWLWSDAELAGVALRLREPSLWVSLLGTSRMLRYEQLYDPHLQVPEGSREGAFGIAVEAEKPPRFPRLLSPSDPMWFSRSENLDTLPRDLRDNGRISQIAAEVLRRNGLPTGILPGESADQVLAKVQALERYLANNPREFTYTLTRPRKAPELDPTVEFLVVPVTEDGKKAGWCQHYASALALLLRSQRIPARVVLGFRGAEWDPARRTHQVRAYHAHAWVEAFIGPRDATGSIVRGRWLAFDPTPGTAIAAIAFRQSPWWKMLLEDLDYLWNLVVLDGSTGRGFRSFATVNAFLDKLRAANLTGAEVVAALARALAGTALLGAALVVWLRWRKRDGSRQSSPAVPITEWQRALIRWLEYILPPRLPGQSLLEYARAAQDRLMLQQCPSPELVALPVRMTEVYYRYRFAHQSPPEQELADLQRQLTELGQFLEQLHRLQSRRGRGDLN